MNTGKAGTENPDIASAIWMAVFMLFAGFIFLAFLSLKPSSNGEDVAAIFPLSMSLKDITSISADLPFTPLRAGWSDNIVIFRPQPGAALEDLRSAGALLVVSAIVNGGCVFLTSDIKNKA
ncbi:hypothetical protein GUA87_08525 [Sneathiella sp. P13V-1]|uniref:hypothetical protein n=1 Tax=Sneathiella sp. P13V-1 TaxID=2697366 RepID=UPI00187B71AE|nr:hypothetical protein [Sneathiella sp. P13V-1]MBE7636887.1 hypothetical protein [Sneathiella sp. P13V-1]